MTLIYIFGLSLLFSLILVLLKALEIQYGATKINTATERVLQRLSFRLKQIIQTVKYLALVRSKEVFTESISKIQTRLAAEYRNREEMLMGRKEIVSNGSASFYLKKISEDHSSGKGRIE